MRAPFIERDACPFCRVASSEVLATLRYHGTAEASLELPDAPGTLWLCRACGVAYPSHIYEIEHFAKLYQKNLVVLEGFRRSLLRRVRHWIIREILRNRLEGWSISTLLDVCSRRAFLVPRFRVRPRGLRILDVGCGFGEFAEAFRELGNEVVSTEIHPEHVAQMRSNGFECHHEELENVDFGGRRFDLIVMRGVLYRTRDPARTLEAAKRLLAEGGELASVDPCPEPEGAVQFFRMQFPQGQFYITDLPRYRAMLAEKFGLRMTQERLIYGRPRAHQIGASSSWGSLVEFGQILAGNLLHRNPHVLGYVLRADEARRPR